MYAHEDLGPVYTYILILICSSGVDINPEHNPPNKPPKAHSNTVLSVLFEYFFLILKIYIYS